ncbi:MAG TPA: hypothetical protein GXX46_10240 [Peptococcaceae bacterium]|nr:hypothetical protein [Peptococcaceae bacterium]
MDYLQTILCGFLLASAVFNLAVFVYACRRPGRNAKYFSLLALCVAIYAFGYGMELYTNSLDRMVFWNLFQYIGLPFIPAFWILFTLEYNDKPLTVSTKVFLLSIPVLTLILRYSNHLHHLYYESVELTTNGLFLILFIHKGPWYIFYVLFITLCIFASNYLYLKMYRKSSGTIRRHSNCRLGTLILGHVLPGYKGHLYVEIV